MGRLTVEWSIRLAVVAVVHCGPAMVERIIIVVSGGVFVFVCVSFPFFVCSRQIMKDLVCVWFRLRVLGYVRLAANVPLSLLKSFTLGYLNCISS